MTPLTPLGTVRRRLGAPQPSATPYPDWLVDSARVYELDEGAVYTSWELARLARGDPEDREAVMALVVASLAAFRRGSTCLKLSELDPLLVEIGAGELIRTRAAEVIERESELFGAPGEFKPFIVEGGCLYHQRTHRQEHELLERLRGRLAAKADRSDYMKIFDALDRVLAHPVTMRGNPVRLSAEQQQAIRTALMNPLTLVSGGPGTGKTSVVVSVLRVLARMDFPIGRVALAASTGRAARRMMESIELELGAVPEPRIVDGAVLDALPESRTLHRLLGYSPNGGRYRHDEDHPLPFDLVIVDEASMIDVELMGRLVRALLPDTKLVLLGDPDQLPPVRAGAAFADLVAIGDETVSVELQQNYRVDRKDSAGRSLVSLARAVRERDTDGLQVSIARRERAGDVTFRGVELLESDVDAFLVRWFRERVVTNGYLQLVQQPTSDYRAAFAHVRSHVVLSVTRSDADRVNQGFELEHPARIGAPVMVTANDYERGVFNGELGIVTPLGVELETGVRGIPLSELSPAYAITVHRSQGSEYDHVAVLLPPAGHPLLNRELLYTALTRARKSVTLLGSFAALSDALKRPAMRRSGLADRLS